MSPDNWFWLALIVKMAITAAFVIGATITAERSGPLVGGLIATLPISAGPAYVFLSLDHDAAFIAESALKSFITNPAISAFAVTYALLARRRSLLISLSAAFFVWLLLVVFFERFTSNLPQALLLNAVVLSLGFWISIPLRHGTIPRVTTYWYDVVLRAGLVTVLVASVVILSFTIGPVATGILAVFPVVFTSVIIILHRRAGGAAASAVMANAVVGLIGFGCALLTLHLAAVPLGTPIALPLALAVSFAWGLSVIGVRKIYLSRA